MMVGPRCRDSLRGLIDDVRIVDGNIVIEPAPGVTPRQLDRVIGLIVRNGARVRAR